MSFPRNMSVFGTVIRGFSMPNVISRTLLVFGILDTGVIFFQNVKNEMFLAILYTFLQVDFATRFVKKTSFMGVLSLFFGDL